MWKLDEKTAMLEELEDALIAADLGYATAADVVDMVKDKVRTRQGEWKTIEEGGLRTLLREIIVAMLPRVEDDVEEEKEVDDEVVDDEVEGKEEMMIQPRVVLVCGVNGAGKTTTMGKLAYLFKESGLKVMLVPCDTFRAAASEQLQEWAARSGAVMSHDGIPPGGVVSPSTIAREGLQRALDVNTNGLLRDERIDVVLVDTSGRLHTDWRLMDELVEVKETLTSVIPDAPHETLMVLDGTTGLNMLKQAQDFHEQVKLTGLVLTKLDGTSKGGCVINVSRSIDVPVKYVGVGEKIDDLQAFDPQRFVEAIL